MSRNNIDNSTCCYISEINQDLIDSIANAFRDVGIRSAVGLPLEHNLAALIIKCKISHAHLKTSRSFLFKLWGEIAPLPGHSRYSVTPFGNQTFSVPEQQRREGDKGL